MRLKDKGEKGRADFLKIGIVSVLFFAIIIFASCSVIVQNAQDGSEALLSDIENYAEATKLSLDMNLQKDFSILNSVSVCLSEAENLGLDKSGAFQIMQSVNMTNGFTRMGYAALDGEADMHDVNGTVYHVNYAEETFFRRASIGQNAIQNSVQDPFGAGLIVNFAVPVKSNKGIKGVLIATHSQEVFSSVVNVGKQDEHSFACIIDGKGNLIVKSNSTMVPSNAKTLNDLGVFLEKDSRIFTQENSDGEIFNYKTAKGTGMSASIKSLCVKDWYLLCAVSDNYVTGAFTYRMQYLIGIFVAALFIYIIMLGFISKMFENRRREQIRNSEENAAVVEQSGKILMRYDITNKTLTDLSEVNKVFGFAKVVKDFVPKIMQSEVILPESKKDLEQFFNDMHNGITRGCTEICLQLPNGKLAWYHGDYTLLSDKKGLPNRSIMSFEDVSAQHERALAYEQQINEIKMLADECASYIEGDLIEWKVIATHNVKESLIPECESESTCDIICNDILQDIYSEDLESFREFFEQNRLILLNAKGITSDEMEFRRIIDGKSVWYKIYVRIVRVLRTDEIKFFALFRNIDDKRSEHEKLLDLAVTDSVTGLFNREAIMSSIEKYLLGEGAQGTHALIMVDLDNFKRVNDTMGHQTGDDALRHTAQTIRESLHRGDIAGRIGGDEFFIFVKNIDKAALIVRVKALIENIQYTCVSNCRTIDISASAGISFYYGDANPVKTMQQLYSESDAALYRSKILGKNTYTLADETEAAESGMAIEMSKYQSVPVDLREVFNGFSSGIQIFYGTNNEEPIFVFANECFQKLVGLSHIELFEKTKANGCFCLIHHDDLIGFRQAFENALNKRLPMQYSCKILNANGIYQEMAVLGNFRFNENGSYEFHAIFINDNSDNQCKQDRL